jgi:biotin transport system substrate-specific component
MSLSVAVTRRDLNVTAARRVGLVLLGAAMIALSSRLMLPIPSSPVPVTAQTLAIILCGALLGPEMAVASVGLFLVAGAAGLPIFSAGGGAA